MASVTDKNLTLHSIGAQETLSRLRNHFSDYPGQDYTKGWSKLWDNGDLLPWDRGVPSPALADTLVNHRHVVGGPFIESDGQKVRKKALVPGCGRGVDVLLLQSFGYDAIGLEVSQRALEACLAHAKEHEQEYPVLDEKAGRGSRAFVQGDFFSDDWFEAAGMSKDDKLDLIYDYTFFCAMRPDMRSAWAQRMAELLKPSSQANLICLEFPTQKPGSAGGPPFSSPPKAYMEHLSHPGESVRYDDEGNVRINPLADRSPNGLERVGHWHPENTHAIGKDEQGKIQDYVSVWRHR